MATYNIKFTDINKTPIIIDQGDINDTAVDVTLFGRIKLEYGEKLNENLLHLLENFACPESSLIPGTPDLTVALDSILSNPTEGQIWFNTTQKVPFIWDGTAWSALASSSDYGANWGKIYHGQQLPLPVSSSGYEFAYSECVWIVTPSGIQQSDLGANGFSYMVCTTNSTGLVNHQYTQVGPNTVVDGVANYMIIGIRKNVNAGSGSYTTLIPPPPPALNNTPTPTVTPTVTPSVGVSLTPTPTATLTVTPTRTVTPTVTRSPTPTPAPSVTPSTSRAIPLSARIYIDPSAGMVQDFSSGPVEHTTGNVTGSTYEKIMRVWVANLTGGAGGPYRIQWNLRFFYSMYGLRSSGQAPPVTIYVTMAPVSPGIYYSPSAGAGWNGNTAGYNITLGGSTTNVTGGVGLNTSAHIRCNGQGTDLASTDSNGFPTHIISATGSISLQAGSSVTIYDVANNSVTYYTPVGSSGQVQGSALTSPPASGSYTDSWNITWN